MAYAKPDTTKPVTYRLPLALVERIDAHRARLDDARPEFTHTLTDAARDLLERGLATVEPATPTRGPRHMSSRSKRTERRK